MNLIGYITYLVIAYIITVHVGYRFYKTGRVYILCLMENDEKYTDSINRLLLICYYLVNLGYAALMISCWQEIHTVAELIGNIATMLGTLIVTLAILHYGNMVVILWLSIRHKKQLKT